MVDKGLPSVPDSTSAAGLEQEDGSVQVNLNASSTSREIRQALRSFGYKKIGTGVREVLLIFARSNDVREAVRKDMALRLTPSEER